MLFVPNFLAEIFQDRFLFQIFEDFPILNFMVEMVAENWWLESRGRNARHGIMQAARSSRRTNRKRDPLDRGVVSG